MCLLSKPSLGCGRHVVASVILCCVVLRKENEEHDDGQDGECAEHFTDGHHRDRPTDIVDTG